MTAASIHMDLADHRSCWRFNATFVIRAGILQCLRMSIVSNHVHNRKRRWPGLPCSAPDVVGPMVRTVTVLYWASAQGYPCYVRRRAIATHAPQLCRRCRAICAQCRCPRAAHCIAPQLRSASAHSRSTADGRAAQASFVQAARQPVNHATRHPPAAATATPRVHQRRMTPVRLAHFARGNHKNRCRRSSHQAAPPLSIEIRRASQHSASRTCLACGKSSDSPRRCLSGASTLAVVVCAPPSSHLQAQFPAACCSAVL